VASFTGYQKRLFAFLGVATFFEGYDFIALTQILPNLRADFMLSKADAGVLVAFINAGTVVAYVLVRKADQWGRRRVLTVTIAGYTLFTLASGLAPDPYTFAVAQFLGRIFLIGEWATAMVYAAEEFPAARRGTVIGVLSAIGSLGSITCAGLVPILIESPFGWRTVYLVSVFPLLLLAVARRTLRESERFTRAAEARGPIRSRLTAIFRGPYRSRLLMMAAVWALAYTCAHTGVSFFKDYAVSDRGWTDGEVGKAIMIAALGAMPLAFAVGWLLDAIGRKAGAVIIFVVGVGGIVGSYSAESHAVTTAMLVFGVFGATAIPAVLNAFTTELFPTELRGDAFAWANNLLGRIGYVLAPLAVGAAADTTGWGPAVRFTAIFPAIALAIIVLRFPETRRRELEETSAL
jgi:putative MFS transporter